MNKISVSFCFIRVFYKNADDFIDNGTYTNYKNLKLRIEQIDKPHLDDLRLSEFDETEIAISKTASADYSVAVNYILLTASKKNTSDIHFDPADDHMKVRFRIDGKLDTFTIVPNILIASLDICIPLLRLLISSS